MILACATANCLVILHGDLFEMAAAYLFHIVKSHPFVDGNERTGAAAALVFPEVNGNVAALLRRTDPRG